MPCSVTPSVHSAMVESDLVVLGSLWCWKLSISGRSHRKTFMCAGFAQADRECSCKTSFGQFGGSSGVDRVFWVFGPVGASVRRGKTTGGIRSLWRVLLLLSTATALVVSSSCAVQSCGLGRASSSQAWTEGSLLSPLIVPAAAASRLQIFSFLPPFWVGRVSGGAVGPPPSQAASVVLK